MIRTLRATALLIALFGMPAAVAAGSPHDLWIKAKCALCHGEDGAGNTPQGKQTHTPDLRSHEVQKHTDAELTEIIAHGHAHMPSFQGGLKPEQVALLVQYIRSVGTAKER